MGRLFRHGGAVLPIVLAGLLLSGCAAAPKRIALPQSLPPRAGQGEASGGSESVSGEGSPGGAAALRDLALLGAHLRKRQAQYLVRAQEWSGLAAALQSVDGGEAEGPDLALCRQRLDSLLVAYERLSQRLETGVVDMQQFVRASEGDMEYLAGECQALFLRERERVERAREAQGRAGAEEMEQAIVEAAGGPGHEEVVAAHRRLSEAYPGYLVAPATLERVALAQVRLGRLGEALELLRDIPAEKSAGDLNALRRLAADLFLATGRLDEARRRYGSLAQAYQREEEDRRWVEAQAALFAGGAFSEAQLRLLGGLLREYLLHGGRQVTAGMEEAMAMLERTAPGSPALAQARQLAAQAREQGGWAWAELEKAEALRRENKFSEALALLDAILQKDVSPETRRLAAEARARVEQSLPAGAGQGPESGEEEAGDALWEKAVHLLESRRYDEAIAAFAALSGTAREEQARMKMGQAANLAANELRQQAAALFVKALKSPDAGGKRRLMLESRRILQEILHKYHGSEIQEKVLLNLKSIEEQIPGGLDAG